MGKKINNLLVNLSSSSFTQREEETTQSSLGNRVEGLASMTNNAKNLKAAWELKLDREVTT